MGTFLDSVGSFFEILGITLFGVAVAAVMSVVIAIPEMWLWNNVVPELFGLKEVTWGQMVCLSLLCGMLFKSYSPARKD